MNLIPIADALTDVNLLGSGLGPAESWQTWLATLKAAFGERLSRKDRRAFAAVAGGRRPPGRKVRELVAIVGRRGGKSKMAAAIAAYIATCVDHTTKLSAGEPGTILVLAASQAQAQIVFGYVVGFLQASPILAGRIEGTTATEVRLQGNVIIAVHSNSFRTIRGRTLLACVFDETAYWKDEASANPDIEVYRAVLPSLMTSGGILVAISTGYRKAGLLYTKWKDHFGGEDPDVLVVQGSSVQFNPRLDPKMIERAKAADPEAADAEWGGGFRNDISGYVDRALVESAVDRGVVVRPPRSGLVYKAFADPSGGVSDSFTLAVAHKDGDVVVLDHVSEVRPPFNPAETMARMAATLRQYGLREVRGDRYSAMWVVEAARANQIAYIHSDLDRSGIYGDCLPLFTSGKVRLLDNDRLVGQFAALERKTSQRGDRIDHPARGQDDLCNAAAGALTLAATERFDVPRVIFGNYEGFPPSEDHEIALWGKHAAAAGSAPLSPEVEKILRAHDQRMAAADATADEGFGDGQTWRAATPTKSAPITSGRTWR
jgi:hypothetical protein